MLSFHSLIASTAAFALDASAMSGTDLPPLTNKPALAVALIVVAVGTAGLVWVAWSRWRQLHIRRSASLVTLVHGTPTDAMVDLLLVCTDAGMRQPYEQWLSTEVLIRTAITAEETVDRLIDSRPDIVWLILDPDTTSMIGLAQELRAMQADAYEAPSWIVALTSDAPSQRAADEAGIFDQVLPEPKSRSASVNVFHQIVASMPKSHGGPWIQQATESAMPGFLASRQALAQSIHQAVRERRNADAAKSAHTLAGSPGMHNFDSGVAACRYIERHHATAEFTELLRRADQISDLIGQIELR